MLARYWQAGGLSRRACLFDFDQQRVDSVGTRFEFSGAGGKPCGLAGLALHHRRLAVCPLEFGFVIDQRNDHRAAQIIVKRLQEAQPAALARLVAPLTGCGKRRAGPLS